MSDSLINIDPFLVGSERGSAERALTRTLGGRGTATSRRKGVPFAVPAGYEVWQAGYEIGIGKLGARRSTSRPGALPKGVSIVGMARDWKIPGRGIVPCELGRTVRVAIGPATIYKRPRTDRTSQSPFGFENRDDADAMNTYVLDLERKVKFGAYPDVSSKLATLFAEWKKKYTDAVASMYVSDADLSGMKDTREKINALTWKPYVDPYTAKPVTYTAFKAKAADATTSNVERAAAATRNAQKAALSPWTIAALAVTGIGLTGGAAFLFLLPKPAWAAYSIAGGLTGGAALFGVGKAIEGGKQAASAALAVVK